MPGDRRSYDPRGLFSEDYDLYLLCQHPAGPHLVAGEKGYPAPKDREWWRQVRPWLRQLSKILKFVPKLSAVGKLYDEQGEKIIQLTLELSSAVADIPPDFAAPADRSARRELDAVLGTDVEAEGAALARAARLPPRGGQDPTLVRPAEGGHQRRQHPVAVRRTCPVPWDLGKPIDQQE